MPKPIAFLYVSRGAVPNVHRASLISDQHEMIVRGVSSVEEGCLEAVDLVREGCQIIELCGGFGADGARRVIQAIHGAIPVGYIEYFPEEREKLTQQKQAEKKEGNGL